MDFGIIASCRIFRCQSAPNPRPAEIARQSSLLFHPVFDRDGDQVIQFASMADGQQAKRIVNLPVDRESGSHLGRRRRT